MSQKDDFRGLSGDKDCYTVKANLLPPVANMDDFHFEALPVYASNPECSKSPGPVSD